MHDDYRPPEGPLPVLHHDRDLVAVDKPAGLLSVAGRRPGWEDCVESRLVAQWGTGQGGVWAVHRLDRHTSGVLVLALRRKAEQALRQQFATGQVEKRYLAVVAGQPPAQGIIDLPLRREGGWPPRNVVDHREGRRARTRFEVLSRGPGHARLLLVPETGRSHQLRVHLAELGHPILGDPFYGSAEVAAAAPRLMLHAWRLALVHPWTGQRVELAAPPPF